MIKYGAYYDGDYEKDYGYTNEFTNENGNNYYHDNHQIEPTNKNENEGDYGDYYDHQNKLQIENEKKGETNYYNDDNENQIGPTNENIGENNDYYDNHQIEPTNKNENTGGENNDYYDHHQNNPSIENENKVETNNYNDDEQGPTNENAIETNNDNDYYDNHPNIPTIEKENNNTDIVPVHFGGRFPKRQKTTPNPILEDASLIVTEKISEDQYFENNLENSNENLISNFDENISPTIDGENSENIMLSTNFEQDDLSFEAPIEKNSNLNPITDTTTKSEQKLFPINDETIVSPDFYPIDERTNNEDQTDLSFSDKNRDTTTNNSEQKLFPITKDRENVSPIEKNSNNDQENFYPIESNDDEQKKNSEGQTDLSFSDASKFDLLPNLDSNEGDQTLQQHDVSNNVKLNTNIAPPNSNSFVDEENVLSTTGENSVSNLDESGILNPSLDQTVLPKNNEESKLNIMPNLNRNIDQENLLSTNEENFVLNLDEYGKDVSISSNPNVYPKNNEESKLLNPNVNVDQENLLSTNEKNSVSNFNENKANNIPSSPDWDSIFNNNALTNGEIMNSQDENLSPTNIQISNIEDSKHNIPLYVLQEPNLDICPAGMRSATLQECEIIGNNGDHGWEWMPHSFMGARPTDCFWISIDGLNAVYFNRFNGEPVSSARKICMEKKIVREEIFVVEENNDTKNENENKNIVSGETNIILNNIVKSEQEVIIPTLAPLPISTRRRRKKKNSSTTTMEPLNNYMDINSSTKDDKMNSEENSSTFQNENNFDMFDKNVFLSTLENVVPQSCYSDFGANLGENVCCGQTGSVFDSSKICGLEAKICQGYIDYDMDTGEQKFGTCVDQCEQPIFPKCDPVLKSYPGAPEDHSVRLNVNLNQFDCNGDGVKDYICQTENGLWYSIWKENKNCSENWGEWNRQPATCSRFFQSQIKKQGVDLRSCDEASSYDNCYARVNCWWNPNRGRCQHSNVLLFESKEEELMNTYSQQQMCSGSTIPSECLRVSHCFWSSTNNGCVYTPNAGPANSNGNGLILKERGVPFIKGEVWDIEGTIVPQLNGIDRSDNVHLSASLESRSKNSEIQIISNTLVENSDNGSLLNLMIRYYRRSFTNPCKNDIILDTKCFQKVQFDVSNGEKLKSSSSLNCGDFGTQMNLYIREVLEATISRRATIALRLNSYFVQKHLIGIFQLMFFPICYDENQIFNYPSKLKTSLFLDDHNVKSEPLGLEFHKINRYLSNFIFRNIQSSIYESYSESKAKMNVRNYVGIFRDTSDYDLNLFVEKFKIILQNGNKNALEKKNIYYINTEEDYQSLDELQTMVYPSTVYVSFEDKWKNKYALSQHEKTEIVVASILIAMEADELICIASSSTCRLLWKLRSSNLKIYTIDDNLKKFYDFNNVNNLISMSAENKEGEDDVEKEEEENVQMEMMIFENLPKNWRRQLLLKKNKSKQRRI